MRRYGQYPLGWQQFGHLGLTSTFGAFTPGEGVGGPPPGFKWLTLNGKYLTLNGKRLMMESSNG